MELRWCYLSHLYDYYRYKKTEARTILCGRQQWLYCAGSTGLHADAQYLLELDTITQRLKYAEVFCCEKCESSEIW